MADSTIGTSLHKLKITSSTLLAYTDESSPVTESGLASVPTITNEMVLDLYSFMCKHSECTYRTLTRWLCCLLGEKWPSDQPPSIKAITQSVKRVLIRKEKLNKLSTSPEKERKIADFLSEEYSLPQQFIARDKLSDSTSESETAGVLKGVNEDLCREIAQLKLENELHKDAEDSIKVLREKMYSLHRNTNKKLGRRDNAISEQSERIDKQKMELQRLHNKVTQMESQLQQLRRDKERYRHKAEYWRSKTYQVKSSSEDQEIREIADKEEKIKTLKHEIVNLEDHNIDLQDKIKELTSTDDEVETFHKGRYNDDIRACCYELLSLNVGIRNIDPVIRAVMSTLAHQSVGRLPSHTVLCRMMEGLSLAEIQLGEKLSEDNKDNFTIQTDGTTKYGQHFATFDVATGDATYTLGLRHVFSGSAQNTLDTLKEILDDLDMVQREIGGAKVSSMIISKLKNTMSDRHAAEKLFNELLADYRAEILPEVFAGWAETSEREKGHITRMNNFFCGLHFMVGLADCAEATVKLWEESHELQVNKYSGTQVLIRSACKSFHSRGSQQAGCSSQFRAYLRSKDIDKLPLTAFRGNRFNILFHDAAGVFFLKSHMIQYLSTSHGSLNFLLQTVLSNLNVPQYIAGCRALGMIDKLVTGPLWRHLQLSTTSVLNMSDVYTVTKEKFEEWSRDAQAVMERREHLLSQHEKEDEVYRMLFLSAEDDAMVQELLQLIFRSFAATVQRLLLDHLPGGEFHTVRDVAVIEETRSVPTTNVNPERDFAVLDRLMSEKPNATHIALESLLLFSHNQTSKWLDSKPGEEKEKLFKAARTLSPVLKSRFKKRREEINTKRREAVKKKEEDYIRKKEKEIRLKESLTKKIQAFGLWTNASEIEDGLQQLKTVKAKCEALKLQLNFRKKVLEQSHSDNTVFFFSHSGKQHSIAQLTTNLLRLLPMEQQTLPAEQFVTNPELLVNKRIEHLFDTEQGLQWYKGTVIGYLKDTNEYRVLYDSEESEYLFPLLDDISNGEVIVYSCL